MHQTDLDRVELRVDFEHMPALTQSVVQRAKPRARKYEIACTRVRGLRLRVLPSGKKVYVARVFKGGKDRRVRIGAVEHIPLEEARRLAIALVEDIQPTPVQEQPKPVEAPTRRRPPGYVDDEPVLFETLADKYLKSHVPTLRPSTQKNYRRAIDLCLERFRGKYLTEIRYSHVEAFHQGHSDRPSAANNYIRVLNHMYKKAAQWEMYPWHARYPTTGLRYNREEGRERFLSPAERRRLDRVLRKAEQAPVNTKGYVRWSHIAAIELLALTGCRESEILDLEWDWIDRTHGVIRFPETKTGKSVRPISDHVLEYLDELERRYRRTGVPYVLYGRNQQRIDRGSFTHAWRRLRRLANLDDVRVHDLRHSAASDAIRAGATLVIVGELLGHKSIQTTKRYSHIANAVARQAANNMTGAILEGREKKRRRRKK